MNKIDGIFSKGTPPFLIAEVGLAHDGSLGLAHKFIDAVASTGADAVKFQTHIAEEESSQIEPFRINFSTQDQTRYNYWKRTSFSEAQWIELQIHAQEKGLIFLSSPFSLAAVHMLERLNIAAWKVPSGELGSRRMLEKMSSTGKPLIVSTGMSSMSEVTSLVKLLDKLSPDRYVLLQCTTEYPTPAPNVGINVIEKYQSLFRCPIGLSDHSGKVWPSIIAAGMGAKVIEVHVTLSEFMFGPDTSSSLSVQELKQLSEGLKFVHEMLVNPLDKDLASRDKVTLRRLFSKSAMALRDIATDEIIDENSISFRKPGVGLSEADYDQLCQRKVSRPVSKGSFLQREDFE